MNAELEKALRRAARQAWLPFAAWVDLDDASQEMWAWVYDGRTDLAAADLVVGAGNAVRAYCQHELAARGVYDPTRFRYTRDLVARLLPAALSDDAFELPAGTYRKAVLAVRDACGDLGATEMAMLATATAPERAAEPRTRSPGYEHTLERLVWILDAKAAQ